MRLLRDQDDIEIVTRHFDCAPLHSARSMTEPAPLRYAYLVTTALSTGKLIISGVSDSRGCQKPCRW